MMILRQVNCLLPLLIVLTQHSACTFGQLIIDGENAALDASGNLVDNNRLIAWQGDTTPLPQIAAGGRMGFSSLQYSANPATPGPGNDVQRSEHRFAGSATNFGGDWSLPDGQVTYFGFSFKLDQNFQYPAGDDFMNIWQMKQASPTSGPTDALLLLGTEHENSSNPENWVLRWRSGQGMGSWNEDSLGLGNLEQDVWYDFILGFKMAANSHTGWISTWIKDETQSLYTHNAIYNQRIGFADLLPSMYAAQIGIHRSTTASFAQVNFDQVRLGATFDDVRPVSNVSGDFNIDYYVAGVDFLEWQRGNSVEPQTVSDLADWSANYGTLADEIAYITPLIAFAGGDLESTGRGADNAVNGNGLVLTGDDANDPGSYTHNGSTNEFGQGNVNWLDQTGGGTATIDDMWFAVDLGHVYNLHTLNFFNMGTSEGGRNFRGIDQADIFYRTDSLGNNAHLNDKAFDPTGWVLLGTAGEQSFTVGPTDGILQGPDSIDMGGIMARYIALDINSNHGSSSTLAGLGELQFFGTPFSGSLQAVTVPEPKTLVGFCLLLLGLFYQGMQTIQR